MQPYFTWNIYEPGCRNIIELYLRRTLVQLNQLATKDIMCKCSSNFLQYKCATQPRPGKDL